MTDTPEIARISAALAAGPTPGPWFVCESINDDGTVDIETGRIAQSEWPPAQNCEFPTCHYIAACNPAAMTAVLAHIEAQASEIERLRKDAERYQWIRKNSREIVDVYINEQYKNTTMLDEAIDEAMKEPK